MDSTIILALAMTLYVLLRVPLCVPLAIREMTDQELVCALKGAEPEMIGKIVTNLSPRAADMFLDNPGWERWQTILSIEEAQRTILKVARQLEADVAIVIMGQRHDAST